MQDRARQSKETVEPAPTMPTPQVVELHHSPGARFQSGNRVYRIVILGQGGVGKSGEAPCARVYMCVCVHVAPLRGVMAALAVRTYGSAAAYGSAAGFFHSSVVNGIKIKLSHSNSSTRLIASSGRAGC